MSQLSVEGCDCPLAALSDGRVVLNRSPRCDVHGPAVRAQVDQIRAGIDELYRGWGELLDAMAAAVAPKPTLRSRLRRRVRARFGR